MEKLLTWIYLIFLLVISRTMSLSNNIEGKKYLKITNMYKSILTLFS